MSNGKFIDMTGVVVERLTVIRLHEKTRRGSRWECLCSCGKIHYAYTSDLRSGHLYSCGCYLREGNFNVKHGHNRGGRRTATYNSWVDMKKRCETPSCANYKWYGGRGISVHQHWQKFENFLADMGERPVGLELDRIDNTLGYTPGNCRWVTHKENCQNRSPYNSLPK